MESVEVDKGLIEFVPANQYGSAMRVQVRVGWIDSDCLVDFDECLVEFVRIQSYQIRARLQYAVARFGSNCAASP